MLNPQFWKGKRVFVTGHTGFKGSWLALWLDHLGARVFGYSLPPPSDPSLFEMARVGECMESSVTGDVRDLPSLESSLRAAAPDVVIHMAAQSLVRYSYKEPIETFSTNVLGTAHLLDAVRRVPGIKSVVVVTSDKCYYNEEWVWGYREDSRLGGHDPYSASKGAAEIVVAAYQHSFFGPDSGSDTAVGSGRAGNVIGGGDWALDRLVPDIMRSLLKNQPTIIRNPRATRPWQHVLEPLNGYLMLAERLYKDRHKYASGWNFGPPESSERTVGWIIEELYKKWGVTFDWTPDPNPGPPENTFLKLDASKAHAYLGWWPRLDLPTTLDWIVTWTRRFQAGEDVRRVTLDDIQRFMNLPPTS